MGKQHHLPEPNKRVFTLEDLGRHYSNLFFDVFSKKPRRNWNDRNYAIRGAVSWGLCTPGYATSYIGEDASGFTRSLTTYVVMNPHLRGNWSVLNYAYCRGDFRSVWAL